MIVVSTHPTMLANYGGVRYIAPDGAHHIVRCGEWRNGDERWFPPFGWVRLGLDTELVSGTAVIQNRYIGQTVVIDEVATLTEADLRSTFEKIRNAPMKPYRLPDVHPKDWPKMKRWLLDGKWTDDED